MHFLKCNIYIHHYIEHFKLTQIRILKIIVLLCSLQVLLILIRLHHQTKWVLLTFNLSITFSNNLCLFLNFMQRIQQALANYADPMSLLKLATSNHLRV